MYDTMEFVHTICMGLAASMGSFVLVGGEITKINIERNGTIIVFFNSSERKSGKWIIYRSGFDRSSTLGKSRFHSRAVCNAQKMPVRTRPKLRETLTRVYVQRTGNPLWVVSEDMERDIFMSQCGPSSWNC
ncbi:hypothetical protein MKW92_012950 [Papaver armeniacum]|nr:hypothetical protein MKW92_012950 [Papaver armeniacum]